MYRLRAVVKPFKAEAVCRDLLQLGLDEVLVEEVRGYGRQKGHLGLYQQQAYGSSFLPKICITAYVPGDRLEEAIDVYENKAITGNIGDGKIFIQEIEFAWGLEPPSKSMTRRKAPASRTKANASAKPAKKRRATSRPRKKK